MLQKNTASLCLSLSFLLVCDEKNIVAFNDSICFPSMGSYRTLNLPSCGSSCFCVRFVWYLSDCSPGGASLSPPFFKCSIIILMICTVASTIFREAFGMGMIAQSMLLLGISSMEVSGADLRRSKHLSAVRAWRSGSKRICGFTRTRFALEKNSGLM